MLMMHLWTKLHLSGTYNVCVRKNKMRHCGGGSVRIPQIWRKGARVAFSKTSTAEAERPNPESAPSAPEIDCKRLLSATPTCAVSEKITGREILRKLVVPWEFVPKFHFNVTELSEDLFRVLGTSQQGRPPGEEGS